MPEKVEGYAQVASAEEIGSQQVHGLLGAAQSMSKYHGRVETVRARGVDEGREKGIAGRDRCAVELHGTHHARLPPPPRWASVARRTAAVCAVSV